MPMTRDDVRSLYLICLGRPVESDEVADLWAGHDAARCAKDLLASAEFEINVVARILDGAEIPHLSRSDRSLATVKSWALQAGRELFGPGLADYTKWYQFLKDVVELPAVYGFFAQRHPGHARFLQILAQRIARNETIVGTVEEANNVRIRGHVINVKDPTQDLTLRLRLNGSTVAIVPVLQFRREFQERYGGTGRVGFEVDFASQPAFADLITGTVDLIETSTGFVLMNAQKLDFSRAPVFELRDTVLASLHDYRRKIDALIEQLEGHGQTYITSLSGYGRARDFARRPLSPGGSKSVTILVDASGTPVGEREIVSCLDQTYPAEAVIVCGPDGTALPGLPDWAGSRGVPVRIAGRDLAEAARGIESDLVLLVKPGETLERDALAWFVYGAERPGARAVFADGEQEVAGAFSSRTIAPVFRSALDPDLLFTSDEYDTPVCLPRVDLAGLEAAESADVRLSALLHCLERHGRCAFRHLPVVLSRNRAVPDPVEAASRRRTDVQRYLDRAHPGATALPHDDPNTGAIPDRSMIRWPVPDQGRIAIVVPTKDAVDMVMSLVESLKSHTSRLSRLHIYVVSNNSSAPQSRLALETLRRDEIVTVIDHDRPFNWAEINDTVIRDHVTEDIVVLLNNDMICATQNWDDLLRAQLARPDVKMVGGRLLYANGMIQHAGVVMIGAWHHEGAGDAPSHGLYRNRTRVARECPVVTGAFLAITRAFYLEIGGFDVENFPVSHNDVEFCVRAEQHGARILYDPEQVWIHFESETRGFDSHDIVKQERAQDAHDIVISRLVRPDYLGLNMNPHFPRHARPFSVIAWPSRDDILSWIDQQETRNAARPAGRPPRRRGRKAGAATRP